jgi:hypothetical protein
MRRRETWRRIPRGWTSGRPPCDYVMNVGMPYDYKHKGEGGWRATLPAELAAMWDATAPLCGVREFDFKEILPLPTRETRYSDSVVERLSISSPEWKDARFLGVGEAVERMAASSRTANRPRQRLYLSFLCYRGHDCVEFPFSEDLMGLVRTALEDMDSPEDERFAGYGVWGGADHLATSRPETRAVWTRDNPRTNRVSLLAHWKGNLS